MSSPLFESSIVSLPLLSRGKVRDIYAVDNDKLLIVTTDRISAFDVILPDPIPGKGAVLTTLSRFWFERFAHIIANQLTGIAPESVVTASERAQVQGRSLVVKRLLPLPIEAVVRAYLAGSGWQEYRHSGSVCGIALPAGLEQASRIPQPVFTPAHKAQAGAHDENISFESAQQLTQAVLDKAQPGHDGSKLVTQARETALQLYAKAAEYAITKGIIIADTKFEFGIDANGTLHLIDEALTPDSSRFWPAEAYRAGGNPPSYDKQYVRDYLETLAWNKQPPAPSLPPEVIAGTAKKYAEVCLCLSGQPAC